MTPALFMKKEILTIEDILNSAEFNEMFDFESEKKEIELYLQYKKNSYVIFRFS